MAIAVGNPAKVNGKLRVARPKTVQGGTIGSGAVQNPQEPNLQASRSSQSPTTQDVQNKGIKLNTKLTEDSKPYAPKYQGLRGAIKKKLRK